MTPPCATHVSDITDRRGSYCTNVAGNSLSRASEEPSDQRGRHQQPNG